jgi:hypothetical protein
VTKQSRKLRSDAGKLRKRVLKAGAGSKALPLRPKTRNGPPNPGPFANNGSKNFQRNQWSVDPISGDSLTPSGSIGQMGTSRSNGHQAWGPMAAQPCGMPKRRRGRSLPDPTGRLPDQGRPRVLPSEIPSRETADDIWATTIQLSAAVRNLTGSSSPLRAVAIICWAMTLRTIGSWPTS